MSQTVRPPLVLRGDWWLRHVGPQAEDVRVPRMDEDEATLAWEASRRALAAANLDPARVEGIRATSRTRPGYAATLARALGVPPERAHDLEPDAWAQARVTAPRDRKTLWVRSDAPRPGEPNLLRHRFSAEATAEIPGAPDGLPRSEPVPADRIVDEAAYERMALAESRALQNVPMGAHVPLATWNRTLEARYRLLASRCAQCGASHHPPVNPCTRCGAPTTVGPPKGTGRIYTFTVVAPNAGPTEFDPIQLVDGAYAVAAVEYPDGLRVAGMVADTDPAGLRIGTPVEPVFRRLYAQEGTWRYGIKFRPTSEA